VNELDIVACGERGQLTEEAIELGTAKGVGHARLIRPLRFRFD